jgi:glycosyltransferase involved in cell wall biosynthesis
VVDGGSTDGSKEIIEKYADRLDWWVSETDMGQAEAINKGFARATGDYIAWLNSDDLYQPGVIEAAVKVLEATPDACMAYGDVVSIDENAKPFNIMAYDDWELKDLMCFNIIGQPGVFMRRTALQKAGYLDLSYRFLLDHHLWLRLAQHGRMIHIAELWASARIHPGAKNVALARGFGQEAYQLAAWMPYQPALADLYKKNRRKIWAGANRMNARYLLDGGERWKSLRAYARSFFQYPPIALAEWRRIVYAAVSLVFNVDKFKQKYLDRRKQNLFDGVDASETPDDAK